MSKAHFPQQKRTKRSPAEWISLGLSTLVVLSLVVMVIFQRVSDGDRPAVIHAKALLNNIRQVGNTFYLNVEVTNAGTKTAEAVRITGTIGSEVREFEIDFLDGDEEGEGVLLFHSDPRITPPLIEVLSFREP